MNKKYLKESFRIRSAEELIKKTTKVIIANMPFSTNMGIMEGTGGAILFLYAASEYFKDDFTRVLADKALVDITTKLSAEDTSFETGISGIGWLLDVLSRLGYIQVEDEASYMNDLTEIVLKNQKFSYDLDSIAIGLYIISRKNGLTLNYHTEQELESTKLISDQILYMLQNRILKHTSCIEDLERKSTVPIDILNMLEISIEINRCVAFLIATRSLNIRVYEVEVILEYYYEKIRLMLNYYPLITLRAPNTFLRENFDMIHSSFLATYNSHINICKSLNKINPIPLSYFKYIYIEKIRLISNPTKESNLFKDVFELTALVNLSHLTKEITVDLYLELTRTRVIKKYSEQMNFLEVNEGKNDNIGLSGISGLGLLLIETLSNKIEHWKLPILIKGYV